MSTKPKAREVLRKLRGQPTSDGAGVRMTRVIGTPQLDHFDPFLLLDEFRSDDPNDYIAGFPDHPHRGFETVTYMIDGIFEHNDSNGGGGVITNGDTQWMTAGSGILHIEKPPEHLVRSGGLFHGFQLWVNLPAAQKWAPPRYQDIRAFERYLGRQGVVIRKFFLHVSRREQKRRFLERLEQPEKNWKFSAGDVRERGFWKDYMRAYEDAIRATATDEAPWYVVPADNKWFTRVVVGAAIIDALGSLDLHYPRVGKEQRKALAVAQRALLAEK